MERINSTDGQFHDGDPSAGTKGTVVTAAWLNALQDSVIGFAGDIVSVAAARALVEGEGVIFGDTTGGGFSVTLPVYGAVAATKRYVIKAIAPLGSADLTIDTPDGKTIDGQASVTIAAGEKMSIIKDGTNWQTI